MFKKPDEVVIVTATYVNGQKVEDEAKVIEPPIPGPYWWWPAVTVIVSLLVVGRA